MTTGSLDQQVRFEASLAENTEAMILADGDGSLLFINPAAEILFGRLNQDLAGITVTDLFPGLCDEPGIAAWKAQVASAGATAIVPAIREARGQRADGDLFPVRLWLSGQLIGEEPLVLVNVQDLSEAERQDRDLAYLRAHDQLTELLNRQEIYTRLAMVAAHARDGGQGVRVICHLDLDQFTIVNITCGPRAGDKLLQQVARLVEAKLAPAEALARVGGDAFSVLLPQGDLDAAVDLCEALMQTVRGFLFTWQDRAFDVALSIGITAWDPRTEPPEEAMGRAEIACRLAKRSGRNRIHVYREGEADLSQFRTDMHLVATINHALSSGGFHLFAQPIVSIGPDAPGEQHFEILVRMVGDAGLLVAPSRFIPAAEHYILMPAVDRWIINHLFVQQGETLRAWHRRHPDAFLFAVNLSGTTVADEGFRRYLKRQFEDCRVPYPSVCFEITETAAIGSLAGAAAFIHEFSALGCRFALDDFGTGLSSYAYLRTLGVHYLKIDGSFVRGLAEDPINRALVESINRVAHVLGLKTIAEWAEDEPTLAALRQIGVDYAQGYAVGAAVLMPAFSLSETDAGPSDLPGPP